MLDSLITYADSLKEEGYRPDSWTNFTEALTFAKDAVELNYSYSVSAADALGEAKDSLQSAIKGLIITNVENTRNVPKIFALYQNYPNPFNPSTQIKYSIPEYGYTSLKVYNLLGEEVATLFEGYQQAGNYSVSFNATGLASGIYLYRFMSNSFVKTKKLILLK